MAVRKGIVIICLGVLLGFLFFPNVSQENLKSEFSMNEFTKPEIGKVNLDSLYPEQFGNLDYRINRFLEYWNIAGASLAVAKDAEIIYTKGFGYADTLNHIPTTPDNMFRMASISKLITAVAIMQLHEQGVLSLDDYVFGEKGILNAETYANYRDKNVEKIKVKHLLNHSGGWTLRYGDPMFIQSTIAKRLGKEGPLTSEDIIGFMLQRRLHFQPGQSSYYSNLGFVILGEVIAEATGMPYETYVKMNILNPLGIYDMHIGKSTHDQWRDKEVCYYEQPDAIQVTSAFGTGELVRKCDGGNNIENLGAAGGWIGSAQSMLKLVLTIDGDGKPFDILSKNSIEMMTDPDPNGFSPYGWRKTTYYGEWIRTGTLAGSTCLIKHAPDGFTYVMLCNTSPWKGSDFPFIMKRFLDRQFARVDAFKKENS